MKLTEFGGVLQLAAELPAEVVSKARSYKLQV